MALVISSTVIFPLRSLSICPGKQTQTRPRVSHANTNECEAAWSLAGNCTGRHSFARHQRAPGRRGRRGEGCSPKHSAPASPLGPPCVGTCFGTCQSSVKEQSIEKTPATNRHTHTRTRTHTLCVCVCACPLFYFSCHLQTAFHLHHPPLSPTTTHESVALRWNSTTESLSSLSVADSNSCRMSATSDSKFMRCCACWGVVVLEERRGVMGSGV